jgi:hypothetical protein
MCSPNTLIFITNLLLTQEKTHLYLANFHNKPASHYDYSSTRQSARPQLHLSAAYHTRQSGNVVLNAVRTEDSAKDFYFSVLLHQANSAAPPKLLSPFVHSIFRKFAETSR